MQQQPVQTTEQQTEFQTALIKKYPNQGFEMGIMKEGALQVIFMWATVIQRAKEGNFDDIRPDILVQHYRDLRSIHYNSKLDYQMGNCCGFRQLAFESEVCLRRTNSQQSFGVSVKGLKRVRSRSSDERDGPEQEQFSGRRMKRTIEIEELKVLD